MHARRTRARRRSGRASLRSDTTIITSDPTSGWPSSSSSILAAARSRMGRSRSVSVRTSPSPATSNMSVRKRLTCAAFSASLVARAADASASRASLPARLACQAVPAVPATIARAIAAVAATPSRFRRTNRDVLYRTVPRRAVIGLLSS